MKTIEKDVVDNAIEELFKNPSANQDINLQLDDLEIQKKIIGEKLIEYSGEPTRRPSKEHKILNQELQSINKAIKKLAKTLKKINYIKEITSKLGYNKGEVILNKTKFYW